MVRWIRRRPRRASQRTGCSSTTPSKGFPWCCSCRCSWWCKCSWMFKRFTLMPLMQMFMVKMIMKCSSAAPPIGSYLICKNPLLVWSISSDKIAYFNVLLQISDFSQCLGFVWNHAIAEYVICCVAMVAFCLFLKSNENCPQNLTCVFFPKWLELIILKFANYRIWKLFFLSRF